LLHNNYSGTGFAGLVILIDCIRELHRHFSVKTGFSAFGEAPELVFPQPPTIQKNQTICLSANTPAHKINFPLTSAARHSHLGAAEI